MNRFWLLALLFLPVELVQAQPPSPTRVPLVRVVDLKVGETQRVKLCNKKTVTVKLVALDEYRDPVRSAVRGAHVRVEVDGREITLTVMP